MIREDLVAERIAVEAYGEIVRFLGDRDITSRRMMEEILAVEEEHADDLKTCSRHSIRRNPDSRKGGCERVAASVFGRPQRARVPFSVEEGSLSRAGSIFSTVRQRVIDFLLSDSSTAPPANRLVPVAGFRRESECP